MYVHILHFMIVIVEMSVYSQEDMTCEVNVVDLLKLVLEKYQKRGGVVLSSHGEVEKGTSR
jgi:hypothetical protein